MADIKTGRIVSQDDWKRTQVRMPQDQYDAIATYAKDNNLSLNTAMLELMDRGLSAKDKIEEMLNEKELLDAIINLQYMLNDQKKLAATQYNQLLLEFETLKNKAP